MSLETTASSAPRYTPTTTMKKTRTKRVPAGMISAAFDDPRTVYDDDRMMAELRFEPRVSEEVHILARAHVNHATFHGEFAPDTVENYTSTWLGGELRAVWAPIVAAASVKSASV